METSVREYINEFGFSIFLSKFIYHNIYKSNSKFAKAFIANNERIIKNKIRNNVTSNIDNFTPKINLINNDVPRNSAIWIMWWQGFKKMPRIVRSCVDRIKALNTDHRVILITKDNWQKYLKLEPQILKGVYNGKISITHLSDIIRVNLLYTYGGIWIDATVFEVTTLPSSLFLAKFFTIKTGSYTNDPSHGMWTTFFMEAQEHSELMGYLVNAFNVYCLKYNEWIDYILFDYFIRIAYEDIGTIREQIEKVPYNNQDVFELRKYLNQPFDHFVPRKNKFTYLYKLSYKDSLNEKTAEGKSTLYHKIVN